MFRLLPFLLALALLVAPGPLPSAQGFMASAAPMSDCADCPDGDAVMQSCLAGCLASPVAIDMAGFAALGLPKAAIHIDLPQPWAAVAPPPESRPPRTMSFP